jgi:predicted metal-binding membrane protein
MLLLGAGMAIEKNTTWGRGLARPLGLVLVAAGAALVVGELLPAGSV